MNGPGYCVNTLALYLQELEAKGIRNRKQRRAAASLARKNKKK